MSRSLKSLKDSIRAEIWPGGEAENLIGAHDAAFLAGLGQLQNDVPGLRDNNCNVIAFEKTWHKCGMTVVPKPPGVVKYVYTVTKDEDGFCDPVFYAGRPWPEPETMSRRWKGLKWTPRAVGKMVVTPAPWGGTNYRAVSPTLVQANRDLDHKFGRAHHGIYAIHQNHIYISPWIQSDEMVVIEWDGLKPATDWTDQDLVSDSPLVKSALKLWVQYQHEFDFGDRNEAIAIFHNSRSTGQYDAALSDLMVRDDSEHRESRSPAQHERWEQSRIWGVPAARKAINACQCEQYEAHKAGGTVYAHISDNGMFCAAADLVSVLARQWWPVLVISSGGQTDIDPRNTDQNLAYDLTIGRNWKDYIFPYNGAMSQAAGVDVNRFWPAIDVNDWRDGLSAFRQFFKLPEARRYYDVQHGDVHFFFLDAVDAEPDGISATSTQAEWLRMKLLLSTAVWKIVVLGRAPVSADPLNSKLMLQWPFAAWGANLVLSGSSNLAYERFQVGGIPYIVNGLGGKSLDPLTGSRSLASFIYDGGFFGAGRITVKDCRLLYEFVTTDGVTQDRVELLIESQDCMKSCTVNAITAGAQLVNGVWANPNGNVLPDDKTKAADYYQEPPSSLNEWKWSTEYQIWQQTMGA